MELQTIQDLKPGHLDTMKGKKKIIKNKMQI